MIRGGKLQHQISIERESESVAPSGTVSSVWLPIATIRAELVQRNTQEFLSGFGDAEGGSAVFRVRYLEGVTLADRVAHGSGRFDIDEIIELGRKRGLELRCTVAE